MSPLTNVPQILKRRLFPAKRILSAPVRQKITAHHYNGERPHNYTHNISFLNISSQICGEMWNEKNFLIRPIVEHVRRQFPKNHLKAPDNTKAKLTTRLLDFPNIKMLICEIDDFDE